LSLTADADNTPVKIVSGSQEKTATIGTSWTDSQEYASVDGTITIYGNVQKINCSNNDKKLTGIDVSHNAELTILFCFKNALTTLDVSNLIKLEYLYCNDNKLTSLDLSKNKQLSKLNCFGNTISSLDLSQNSQLEIVRCYKNALTKLNISGCSQMTLLHCGENRLTSLDVSGSTKLERLFCNDNDISKLDVSNNKQLSMLFCYSNKLSVEAFDDLFCSLPNRKDQDAGKIAPTLNKSSAEKDKILATNGINAITRNWDVQYYEEGYNIGGFKGTHQCGGGTGIDETKGLPALAVYPNPAKDVINIASDKPIHSIRIYNVYGTEVAHATDATSIDVSQLPAGV
ncbi:MAG: T9SS type A sorting domain-containing protein, partial [Bacteroidota bacterium]